MQYCGIQRTFASRRLGPRSRSASLKRRVLPAMFTLRPTSKSGWDAELAIVAVFLFFFETLLGFEVAGQSFERK